MVAWYCKGTMALTVQNVAFALHPGRMCFNVFFMAVSICALYVATKRHITSMRSLCSRPAQGGEAAREREALI